MFFQSWFKKWILTSGNCFLKRRKNCIFSHSALWHSNVMRSGMLIASAPFERFGKLFKRVSWKEIFRVTLQYSNILKNFWANLLGCSNNKVNVTYYWIHRNVTSYNLSWNTYVILFQKTFYVGSGRVWEILSCMQVTSYPYIRQNLKGVFDYVFTTEGLLKDLSICPVSYIVRNHLSDYFN